MTATSLTEGINEKWSSHTKHFKGSQVLICFLGVAFQPKGSGEPEGRGAEAAAAAGAWKE